MAFDTKKLVHVAGSLFLLAVTAAVIWQMTGPSWFKNIKAEVTNQPYARTVTVDGEGKVTIKPDIATVDLSVESAGRTVKEVTADGNKKMADIVAFVKNLGVDAKDIVTSSYYLYPVYPPYNYDPAAVNAQVPKISGYTLNQTVTVKIRNLDNVDEVLDGAIKAGANQVGQLNFSIDDDSKVKNDARDKAFKAAREKADLMAASAGVKIGRVITFSESGGVNPVPYYGNVMMAKSEAANAPAAAVEPGSKDVTVDISVTYEIE